MGTLAGAPVADIASSATDVNVPRSLPPRPGADPEHQTGFDDRDRAAEGFRASGVSEMRAAVPLVDYLVLDDEPHLEANECAACAARCFDRRNACAACGATSFVRVRVPSEGEVRAFTIVSMAAPGIPVPFVASVIDCGGTSVRANLVNVMPDPEHVKLGMKVRLVTYSLGVDEAGTEAIGFGFEPVD